jgi:hypothetical protein
MQKGKIHVPKIKLLVSTEMQECKAYWQWAQTVPILRDYLFKIVNEGKRSVIYGHQLKLIGMRKGLPDYHLPVANNNWNGFWLEMKIRNKSEKSLPEEQKIWVEKLREIKHYASFAYGWEDASKKTLDYINNII